MNEGEGELVLIEAPSTFSRQIAGLEDHLLRGRLILEAAREPMTVEDFHTKLCIPIASTYRVVTALTRLGWLRVCGYRTRAGTHGVLRQRGAKMYVSTSDHVSMHPHPCGKCRMTLYSPEHERRHQCR